MDSEKGELRRWPLLTDRYSLGSGGPLVSPVCLGIVKKPGFVREAFERGINFFAVSTDTHWPVYGTMREGLADLIRSVPGARERIVVMGICYATNPKLCHLPFQELLESEPSLGGIDISAMGCVSCADFLLRWNEHEKHRTEVRGVRAIAGMFDEMVAARVAVSTHIVDLAFVPCRPSSRSHSAWLAARLGPNANVPVFAIGAALEVTSRARMTELGIDADKWRPEKADYFRYALTQPWVSGVYCTAREEGDLEQISAAFREGALTPEQSLYLDDLSDLDSGLAELDRS